MPYDRAIDQFQAACEAVGIVDGFTTWNGERRAPGFHDLRRTDAERLRQDGRGLRKARWKLMATSPYTIAARAYNARLRLEVFTHYCGGTPPHCQCPGCKTTAIEFLQLDHVDGDGAAHGNVNNLGTGGAKLWRWVKSTRLPCGLSSSLSQLQRRKVHALRVSAQGPTALSRGALLR